MKLKKQKQVIDANDNSVELVHKSVSKDKSTSLKFGSGLMTAESAGDERDINLLGERAIFGSENDGDHGDRIPSKQPSSNAVFNCSSSKKVKNLQVPDGVTQGRGRPARVPSAQVPPSRGPPAQVPPAQVPSAQVPPARVQPARSCKSFMRSCYNDNSIADVEATISSDITGRRTKRLRKSADEYKRHGDGNSEEDDEKYLPLRKRARFRMTESLHQPSFAQEQIDGQAEDEQPPGIRNNQPISGLVDGEAALPLSKHQHVVREAISVNAAQGSQMSSDGPAAMKTSVNEHCSSSRVCAKATLGSKEGAEVGSTKLKSLNEHFVLCDASVATVSGKPLEEVPTSSIPPSSLTHEACKDAKEALDCGNGEQNGKVQAPQLYDVPVVSVNEYCSSSSGECAKATLESNKRTEVGSTKPQSLDEHFVDSDASVAELSENPLEEVPASSIPPSSLIREACKDAKEALECGDDEQNVEVLAPQLDERETSLERFQGSHLLVKHLSNDSKRENAELSKPFTEPDAQILKSMDPVSQEKNSSTSAWKRWNSHLSSAEGSSFGTKELRPPSLLSAEKGANSHLSSAEDNAVGTIQLCHSSLHEETRINAMSGIVKGSGSAMKNPNAISSPGLAKVLITAHQGQNPSDPIYISDDQLGEKAVSTVQSSSTMTEGVASVRRPLPLSIPTCYMSTVSNNNNNLGGNSSCFTPGDHPHAEKQNLAEKWSTKTGSDMALPAFESILGRLNATDDSITGAAVVAIECLKLGGATKVVEIIIRELETETSLHNKINLFFLVDCITKYSRMLEGDLGEIYPSAFGDVLPRLLSAAAPPGSSSLENSRQCLKVLRIWQQQNIIRESIIRDHIRELDLRCGASSGGGVSHSLRRETAFDQGGSNSNIQLFLSLAPPLPEDIPSVVLALPVPSPPRSAFRPPVRSRSTKKVADGAIHIRPPLHATTNQFSYVQADQRRKSPPPVKVTNVKVLGGASQARPPHQAPQNQFSYVQADQQGKSPPPGQSPSNIQVADAVFQSRPSHHGPPYQSSYVQADQQTQSPPPVQSHIPPPQRSPTDQFSYVQADKRRQSPPVQPMSNIQLADGAFQSRPPHHATRDQVSYVQADQRRQSPPPVRSLSNTKVAEGASHSRLPHNAPTNQFSYIQADQRRNSIWEGILPLPNLNEPPTAPVSDPTMQPNGPLRFGHEPTRTALPVHMWSQHPWGISPSQYLHQRPPPGGPFPESSSRGGSIYWRPR